jgi:hypothetical protein
MRWEGRCDSTIAGTRLKGQTMIFMRTQQAAGSRQQKSLKLSSLA